MLKKYKCVFLDFYGTLVEEDDEIIDRIVRSIARVSPVSNDPKEIGDKWNFSDYCKYSFDKNYKTQRTLERESLQHLLEKFEVDLDADMLSSELYSYWESPKILNDTMKFLETLNIPVCIVSNIDRADIMSAMENLGLKFDSVVTSEDCKCYKPNKEIFERALNLMGVLPNEVIHIGDSFSSDVLGAYNAGIDSAWLNRKSVSNGGSIEPNYVIASLQEIFAILNNV